MGITITLISSRVKPRPARIFLWYLTVGHLTTGRRGPAAGRGNTARAFFTLFCFLLCLRAGWLNQVFTNRCQSLWKCPFGIILFPLPILKLQWNNDLSKTFTYKNLQDTDNKVTKNTRILKTSLLKGWLIYHTEIKADGPEY